MKRAFYFGFLCLPLVLFVYCTLINDNARIEGNWWQNYFAGPNGTVFADSKNYSSNQVAFNTDRTYSSANPFTGDQSSGTWTIDSTTGLITINIIPSPGSTNSNMVFYYRYDFPDSQTLKLINPTNTSFFIIFKHS
jgi:hypothetical protein